MKLLLICLGIRAELSKSGSKSVVGRSVYVCDLVCWLEEHLGKSLGCQEQGDSSDAVIDEVLHELAIVNKFKSSSADADLGCVQESVDCKDEEEEALRIAERLVYGWPSKSCEPTGVQGFGRFVRSFPLDFPMGVGDLYEERPRKVSVEVWVQHLLRYKTGHFVGGLRGQRLLWAMVNNLLLSEARSRGHGIYRNVVRRVGLGIEGGGVLTKGHLREILKNEHTMRVLVGQLSTVGRDVRSTTMQWAYESKKLESTVKHLSWIPPWVDATDEEGHSPVGQCFIDAVDCFQADGTEVFERSVWFLIQWVLGVIHPCGGL